MTEDVDAYSAFFDNKKLGKTHLHDYLQSKNVSDLFVCGLATDFCVDFTIMDALSLGYNVTVYEGCIRGVAEDTTEIINKWKTNGANVISNETEFKNLINKLT